MPRIIARTNSTVLLSSGCRDRASPTKCLYIRRHTRVPMPVKTTILLREDVKDHLLRKVGPRGLSEAINEILAERLFRAEESLFGADPWLDTEGLRDEGEPHEDL